MLKSKIFAVALSAVMLFSGCQPAADTSTVNETAQRGGLVSFITWKSPSVGTSNGYYEYFYWPLDMYEDDEWTEHFYANLLYTDYQTKSTVFLCGTPGCRHNTDSCTSFICFTGSLELVSDSTGTKIFLIDTGGTIWSMNVDGSGREVLFQLQPDEAFMHGQIFADQTSLYLCVDAVDSETLDVVTELREFNTVDLTSQTILTLGGRKYGDWLGLSVMRARTAYGEYIFLSEYLEEFIVFYRYSLSTGSMTKAYILDVPDPANSPYYLIAGKYLFITKSDETEHSGSLTLIDLIDGSGRLITGIPASPGGMPFLSYYFGDIVEWSYTDAADEYFSYFVDVEKMTFRERTLTYYDDFKEADLLVEIVADAGEEFLVCYGSKESSINLYNLNGVLYHFDAGYPSQVYALMDKADFYNNVPNFRPITDYVF